MIAGNKFDKLYEVAHTNLMAYTYKGELSQVFLDSGIDFLKYMSTVPKGCFFADQKLTNITIPGNIDTIDIYAFQGCDNLKTVVLEDGVGAIFHQAFLDCDGLQSIKIPASVTYIAKSVFDGCPKSMKIITTKGAPVIQYAKKHDLRYELV